MTGLDFSSLYPSIIITYNLSPEKFVESAAEAARLEAEGRTLHHTEFPFDGERVQGWFVRHNGVSEDYGLYPLILIDLSEKRAALRKKLAVQEKLKEHMEVVMAAVEKRAAARGEPAAAVFPGVLAEELAAQQRRAAGLGRPRRGAERETAGRYVAYLAPIAATPAAAQLGDFRSRYDETCFEFASIDSKQRALKVFMNTFYGEAGNSISPFFLLQLAGGVTTAGRYNIKKVADFVLANGFRIKYGDTDSLYLSPPEHVFAGVDRRYGLGALSREEYWREMVEITMTELDALRDQVNAHLRADNGTPHLRMAYEEVLFPVAFTGKKKYFGIAHISVPNFSPKTLFIRGIDVVKQGQTELAKKIAFRVMWAAVALENREDLCSIVERVLRDAIENRDQWSFDDFVRSDTWKPTKNNIPVQRFIARMGRRVAEEKATNEQRRLCGQAPLKALYSIPDPGERFYYVLTKPDAAFDLRGFKIPPRKGDMMEYAEVARALNLPINVEQYLKSSVIGQCARFINHGERFLPPAHASMDEKQCDQEAQNAAKKHLEGFVAHLQNADPGTLQKRGYAYKRAWKDAARTCSSALRATIGPLAEILHGDRLDWDDLLSPRMVETLAAKAEAFAGELLDPKGYARALGIAENGSDIDAPAECTRLYQAVSVLAPGRRGRRFVSTREAVLSALDRRESAIRARLGELAPRVVGAAAEYEAFLTLAVLSRRAHEHACSTELGEFGAAGLGAPRTDFVLDEASSPPLAETRRLWCELVGVYRARAQHRGHPGVPDGPQGPAPGAGRPAESGGNRPDDRRGRQAAPPPGHQRGCRRQLRAGHFCRGLSLPGKYTELRRGEMQTNEAVLISLLVVLIVVVVFQARLRCSVAWYPLDKGSFTGGSSSVMSPYTPLQMQDGAIRGARHDAFNQDHAYLSADLAKNYRSWATTPRDLEEAQRAAWFEAISNGHNAYYNPEVGGDTSAELMAHHTPGPSINYQDTLVDLVADPRMRAQQANWYSEVAPKTQTAMKIDSIDEAATMAAAPRSGLYSFRFSAPSQHNPLFLTDQDAESYGVQTTRFSFGG